MNSIIYKNITKKDFKFSVVMAVYNSELYLHDAIESIINQDINFLENIQLIIVNDGSVDNSLKIAMHYFEQYSENIIVIDQQNKGVSASRNAGVIYATGKYINFMDSDDAFSVDSFRKVKQFFDLHEHELDVVTIKTELCGLKTGNTWFNNKFEKGTRIINLWKEPQVYLNSTNSSFFHKRIKNQLHFDEELSIAEDLKVVNTVMMNKWALGVVSDAKYFYRIHKNSLVDKAKEKKCYYIPYLKRVFFWFYEKSMKQCGFFPDFLQYTLFRDLYNRFAHNVEVLNVLTNDEYLEYSELLIKAIKCISVNTIVHNSFCNSDYQLYFMKLKTAAEPIVRFNGSECVFAWNGCSIKKKPYYCINNISIENGEICIEGYAVINNIYTDNVDIFFETSSGTYEKVNTYSTTDNEVSYGDNIIFYRKHRIAI